MPPRHVYWTIIYGNQATSFRSATREELLPTLRQLQSRHPDAALKFFARGRIWDSEEEARQRPDSRRRFEDRPKDRRETERGSGKRKPEGERRGKDWRPGGRHQDPRDRWKVPRDVKRKRFAQRQRWQASADRKNSPGQGTGPKRPRREPKKGDDE